jgi:hypothetical protein
MNANPPQKAMAHAGGSRSGADGVAGDGAGGAGRAVAARFGSTDVGVSA